MFLLQSQEGQHDHGRGGHVAFANAVSADRASSAPQRPAISSQLFASQLARLSLLGNRTRSVIRLFFCQSSAGRLRRLRHSAATAQAAMSASNNEISAL